MIELHQLAGSFEGRTTDWATRPKCEKFNTAHHRVILSRKDFTEVSHDQKARRQFLTLPLDPTAAKQTPFCSNYFFLQKINPPLNFNSRFLLGWKFWLLFSCFVPMPRTMLPMLSTKFCCVLLDGVATKQSITGFITFFPLPQSL